MPHHSFSHLDRCPRYSEHHCACRSNFQAKGFIASLAMSWQHAQPVHLRVDHQQEAGHHYACRNCGVCIHIPNEYENSRKEKCHNCKLTTTCNAWRNMRYIADPQEYTCLMQTLKRAQTEAHTALASLPYTARNVWQKKIALWGSAWRALLHPQRFPRARPATRKAFLPGGPRRERRVFSITT